MTEETAADSVVANVLPALVVLFIVGMSSSMVIGSAISNGGWDEDLAEQECLIHIISK
jgi:hypothetical protein